MMPARQLVLLVIALGLGSFAVGTSEFAAMGLLPFYAADLSLTESQAGHVVSIYALGVVIGAPLTSLMGIRLPRRRYLAVLIAFYGVMNLASALLTGYAALLTTRFLAGLPHGGYLGVAMLYVADAMPRDRRAQAASWILMGLAAANVVGVPFAGWLGQSVGWRWGFALPGVIGLAAAGMIWIVAPRGIRAGEGASSIGTELAALRNPAVLSALLVGAIGFGGMFAVYAFLSAAILATTSAPDWAIPVALSLFGIGSLTGNWLVGRMTDRIGQIPAARTTLIAMVFGQAFAAAVVGLWPLMLLSALLLGITGSGLGIPLQTRLMDVAGRAQNMAAALNHAAFNLANALGPWLAGMALAAGWGWRSPGLVAIALSLGGLAALSLVNRQRHHHNT